MNAALLRILMFSDAYGGVTNTFIRNEVDYLTRHHRLKYLTLMNETPETTHDVEVITPCVRPLWDPIEWRLWTADIRCSFRNAAFAKRLCAAIDRFRPDVIHCHFAYEALRLLQNVDITDGPPIVVHFHGYDASEMIHRRSYIRALAPILATRNVQPIVVSQHMRRELEDAGLDMTRAHLLRYGVDLGLFKPGGPASPRSGADEVVIVQVSSLIPKKGHRETLHAMARMIDRTPSLRTRVLYRIVGEGPDENILRELAANVGVAENVEFLGPLAPSDVVPLLEHADVFVHHSVQDARGHKEGIPNAIMEAMAMELPILSTLHAGIPELVEHGVHGLLCRERDVETFSRQMEEILTWGRRPANRDRIAKEYNLVSHNASLERIYRQVIGQG